MRATLDDPASALQSARAEADAGDPSWQQWLAEYERGEALVVRLDVQVQANVGDGVRTIDMSNHGIFVEAHPQPPAVERQIADIASKDYSVLARELSKLGHQLDREELSDMYVHVELGEDLHAALADFASQDRTPPAGAPDADIRMSHARGPR